MRTHYNGDPLAALDEDGECLRSSRRPTFTSVAYDFGIKQQHLRSADARGLPGYRRSSGDNGRGCAGSESWMGFFRRIYLGDPEPVTYAHESIRKLAGKKPIFGICLGHQLIGIALGGKTYKLKFGHHGGNHPVKQMDSGKVEITAHNHNFAVDPDSLKQSEVDLTHVDLNDNTLEGIAASFDAVV